MTGERPITVDEELLEKFITDVAQGIYDYDTIGERYGLGDAAGVFWVLQNNPYIRRLAKRAKAAFDSDEAVDKRVRLKAGLAVERLIPQIADLVDKADTPTGQKIDGFHKLMRAAGTDGAVPAPTKWGEAGAAGPTFTLNFIWSDGRKEAVLTTVAPAAPAIEHEAPEA